MWLESAWDKLVKISTDLLIRVLTSATPSSALSRAVIGVRNSGVSCRSAAFSTKMLRRVN